MSNYFQRIKNNNLIFIDCIIIVIINNHQMNTHTLVCYINYSEF